MENQDSKTKIFFSKLKNILLYLWPLVKKDRTLYNLKSIRIPRTSGRTLKILVTLIRFPIIRFFFIPILLHQAGLKSLRKFKVFDDPVMSPDHPLGVKLSSNIAQKSVEKFFDSLDKKKTD